MKKILKTSLIFSAIFSLEVHAQSAKNSCVLQPSPAEKIVKINDIPSYFYKVHPSGKYIAFIGSKGNQLLEIETGKTIPLPGAVDPVFTSDGKYLVVPMFKDEYAGPLSPGDQVLLYDGSNIGMQASKMTFYDANLFVDKFKNPKAPKLDKKDFSNTLYRDEDNNGVYQSVSLAKDGSYNLISDKRGVSIQNYKISKNGSESDELHDPCTNIDNFPTDLPILSKDGRFLSVNNTKTKSTQIYELLENNECHMALDLGLATGKVSFNKDSSKIVFHMDHFNESLGGYFSGTATDLIKDVYTMNLKHSKDNNGHTILKPTIWAKVSNTEQMGNGSYYPDFSNNDELFYLSDVDNYFQFSKVNLNQLTYVSFDNFIDLNLDVEENSCLLLPEKLFANFILGQIWSKACAKLNDVTLKDATLLSMSLNASNCKEMVTNNWDDAFKNALIKSHGNKFNLSALSSITKKDLQAACPQPAVVSATKSPKVIGKWDKRDQSSFKEVLKQKCLNCHTGTIEYKAEIYNKVFYDEDGDQLSVEMATITKKMPPIDINNMDIKTANKLVKAVSEKDPSKRMPKGASLKASEIQLFYENAKDKELSAKLNEQMHEFIAPMTVYTYSDEKIEEMLQEHIESNKNLSATDKTKKFTDYKKEILCLYKQKGCKERIAENLNKFKATLNSATPVLSSSEREESITRELLRMKCIYAYDVTVIECTN